MKLYFSKLSFSFRSHVCCTACQAPGLWYVKFTNDYISALICTVSKPSTTLFLPYANPSLDTFDRVSIPEVVPVLVCNKSVTQNSKFKTWIRVHSENSRDYYAPWRLGLFLLSCDHRFQTLIVRFGDQIVSPIFRFNFWVTLVASYLEWFDWNTRVFIRDAWWLDSVYWHKYSVCMRDFNREEEEVYRTYDTVMNRCLILSHHESQVYVCKWLFESGCQA
jgi:hypothetical protein